MMVNYDSWKHGHMQLCNNNNNIIIINCKVHIVSSNTELEVPVLFWTSNAECSV